MKRELVLAEKIPLRILQGDLGRHRRGRGTLTLSRIH